MSAQRPPQTVREAGRRGGQSSNWKPR
ncbi:KGG domain-containing protein [Streptomyces thermocarboxydus]